MVGNVTTLCRWLGFPEIADSVSLCPLEPYDISVDNERAVFLSLLKSYEQVMPWIGQAPLIDKIEQINSAVSGCPVRLRKWMISALVAAKAEGASAVNWSHVTQTAPLTSERQAAAKDLTSLKLIRRPLAKVAPDTDKKPNFTRSLERDDVGSDAA